MSKRVIRKIGEYMFKCPKCGCNAGVYLTYDGFDYVPNHFLVGSYMCCRCGHTSVCYDCSNRIVQPIQLSLF